MGGALLAGLLAARADHRVEMLAAVHTIQAGQVITQDDLGSSPVSSTLSGLIPATRVDEVIGQTARTEIGEGQLLDTSQLATAPVVGEGRQVVGAALDRGRFPAGGLAPGDLVDVVDITTGNVIIADAQVLTAVATSGAEDDWTSGTTVSLIVTEQDAATLATTAAAGQIALVLGATDQPIEAS